MNRFKAGENDLEVVEEREKFAIKCCCLWGGNNNVIKRQFPMCDGVYRSRSNYPNGLWKFAKLH